MKLYLLRHAQAEEGVPDALRPLSAKGCTRVRRLAEFLSTKELLPEMPLWHTPLQRSAQTASLLVDALNWDPQCLRQREGFLPEDSTLAILRSLRTEKGSLCLVGHEPQLGRLASHLLTGDAEAVSLKLRKGALLCLEGEFPSRGPVSGWSLRWHLGPECYE